MIPWMVTLCLAFGLGLGRDDGDADYAAGRYRAALMHFAAAVASTPDPDPATLFKIGNCHYRLGEFARAILHYRRGLLRDPRHQALRANLEHAERQLGLQATEPAGFARALRSLGDRFTARELLAVLALAQTTFLGAALLWRGRRRAVVTCIGAAILLSAAQVWSVCTTWSARETPGMVLAPRAAVRAEPHPTAPVATELLAGTSVEILAASPRWIHARSASGTGWIAADAIGRID